MTEEHNIIMVELDFYEKLVDALELDDLPILLTQ